MWHSSSVDFSTLGLSSSLCTTIHTDHSDSTEPISRANPSTLCDLLCNFRSSLSCIRNLEPHRETPCPSFLPHECLGSFHLTLESLHFTKLVRFFLVCVHCPDGLSNTRYFPFLHPNYINYTKSYLYLRPSGGWQVNVPKWWNRFSSSNFVDGRSLFCLSGLISTCV